MHLYEPSHPYLEIARDDNLNLSFRDRRGFLSRLGMEGKIIPLPGQSDDSISLILDEGIALYGRPARLGPGEQIRCGRSK